MRYKGLAKGDMELMLHSMAFNLKKASSFRGIRGKE